MQTRPARIVFSVILVVVGLVTAVLAANVAFGGIRTLGWQGTADFLTVTDQAAFDIRDNHVRFFGGLFLVLGVFLVVAATNVQRFRGALLLAFALVFAGGLARFTQGQPEVTFGPAIITSAIVELVLMPALFVWLWRSPAAAKAATATADK